MAVRKPQKRKDCYRLGDPDFDRRRERFYANMDYALREPPALVLPLIAFYGFEPETVKRRAAFYADCARVFGWKEWELDPEPYSPPTANPGRDQQPREVQKYGNAGIASYRDQASDAMTWLILNKHLNSKVDWPRTDEKLEQAWSEGNARHTTAQELERLFEKAELTPLRSPDFGGVPTGGFGSRYVGVSKLISQMVVQDLRRDMPPALMALLERILVKNEHPWHGLKKKAQDAVFEQARMALDMAGWVLMKIDAGKAGEAAIERARVAIARRWPALDDWFYQRRLRPAVHMGRVIKKALP